MEVHHHPNVEKKNFKEYFLEFLMIFLAVTMGFFAETLRESITENEKAKQLAENLYHEVYADSVIVEEKIKLRMEKEKKLMQFANLARDSSLTNPSKQFMPSFFWSFVYTSRMFFEPKNDILVQLINSGTLRFFKSNELQKEIGSMVITIDNIKKRNDVELSYNEFYTRPFLLKHFNFDWYEILDEDGNLSAAECAEKLKKNIDIPVAKIVNAESFDRQQAISLASYELLILRGTRNGQYKDYKTNSRQLLEILRKEYHLKND